MSTTVSYKGSTIATVENNTKTLTTAGKYLEADVILTDVSGSSIPDGNLLAYGYTDPTLPLVGVAQVGYAEI